MSYSIGLSLIEVLISFLLLSMMLLSLDVMQLKSLQQAKAVFYYSIANQQLHNMAEHLLERPSDPLEAWNKQNQVVLPQGIGGVIPYHSNLRITLFWGKQKENQCYRVKIGNPGCLQRLIKLA